MGFLVKNNSHKRSFVSSSFVVVMTGMVILKLVLKLLVVLKWMKMVQAARLVLEVISLQNLQLPLVAFGSLFFALISLLRTPVTLPS